MGIFRIDMLGFVKPLISRLKIYCQSKKKCWYIVDRKFDDFTDGGKVANEIAKVRYEYFNNKRKAKLLALNNQILKNEIMHKSMCKSIIYLTVSQYNLLDASP